MNLKVYLPFLLALGLLSVVIVIDRKSFNRVEDYTAQVDRTRELINRLTPIQLS